MERESASQVPGGAGNAPSDGPPAPASRPRLRQDPRSIPATTYVWALMAINVAVWLAMEAVGSSTDTRTLVRFGAKVNQLIAQGEYFRLLTPIFVHIGLTHLLFNSFALLSFGRLAEIIYGHSRFLAIYLVSGITGVVLSYCFSRSLSAGASGAIFGVAGALVMFYVFNRGVPAVSSQGELTSMIVVLVINGIFGVVQPGIDNWGHAGGLVGGLALGACLSPRLVSIIGPEGEAVVLRAQRSGPASWLAVPLLLAVAVLLVVVVPPPLFVR